MFVGDGGVPAEGAFVGIFFEVKEEGAVGEVLDLEGLDLFDFERGHGAGAEGIDGAGEGGEEGAGAEGDAEDGVAFLIGREVEGDGEGGDFWGFGREEGGSDGRAGGAIGEKVSEGDGVRGRFG